MTRRTILVALATLAAVGVGVLVWWLSGDEPAPVDPERAIDQDRVGDESTDITEHPAPENDLDGRWAIDASRPVDLSAGRGTFVGYRVQEELANIGANTAIGRTADVEGFVEFSDTALIAAEITADLTALESDDSRRDGRVRTMLGPDAAAHFVLDGIIGPGEVPALGEIVEVDVAGMLTIVDVTQPLDVRVEVGMSERGLVVTGSTTILLDDFSIAVPSAAIVLSASNEAVIEWQLFLTRQPT